MPQRCWNQRTSSLSGDDSRLKPSRLKPSCFFTGDASEADLANPLAVQISLSSTRSFGSRLSREFFKLCKIKSTSFFNVAGNVQVLCTVFLQCSAQSRQISWDFEGESFAKIYESKCCSILPKCFTNEFRYFDGSANTKLRNFNAFSEVLLNNVLKCSS